MKQVVQQRRNPTWDLHERTVPTRFFLLVHKRTKHAVALGSAGRLYDWKYALGPNGHLYSVMLVPYPGLEPPRAPLDSGSIAEPNLH